MKLMWISCGLILGLASISMALGSVPKRDVITDDTALYQKLTELRVQKQSDLNFDPDIARLSEMEGRYREKLPSVGKNPRLLGPMKRISAKKYR